MKKYTLALIVPTALGVLALTNYNFHRKNDIYVETQRAEEGIHVEKALSPRMYRANELTDYSVAVQFEYESFEADSEAIENGEREQEMEASAEYHYGTNLSYATHVDLDYDTVFVSKYSPLVIYGFNQTTLEAVMAKVDALAYTAKIHEIHVYETALYEAKLDEGVQAVESTPNSSVIDDDPSGASDIRVTDYDNFPVGTSYTGFGIKIGLFDIGLFDINDEQFADIDAQVIYDTNTANDDGSMALHPTWVASILGGDYGISSQAAIYFADVNSADSYMGIERLIDAGVDLVNMSVSIGTVTSTTYDTSIEYYFDYLYTSTKIVMVAAAGNSLNEYGRGGYVGLPAMCANVITVGSLDSVGSPSDFSSYHIANDVTNKPNLVAMGDHRQIPGASVMSGTSLSAPAVTGALGLLFQKRGVLDMPTALACLEASANPDMIDNSTEIIDLCTYGEFGFFVPTGVTITCTNGYYLGGGFRERTGAGALDITHLLETATDFTPAPVTMASTSYITLASNIYLTAGQQIQFALAWERTGTVTYTKFLGIIIKTTYSHNVLPNLDVAIVNSSGTAWKTYFTTSNSDIMDYRCNVSGLFSIKVKPVTGYTTTTGVNYAYLVY